MVAPPAECGESHRFVENRCLVLMATTSRKPVLRRSFSRQPLEALGGPVWFQAIRLQSMRARSRLRRLIHRPEHVGGYRVLPTVTGVFQNLLACRARGGLGTFDGLFGPWSTQRRSRRTKSCSLSLGRFSLSLA